MNYWERWIGDWKKKTAALSFEQKGAYGELLDYLYANETHTLPLDKDAVYRIAGAFGASERRAVDSILLPEARFFILDDAGYHQKRVSAELEKRRAYVGKQRELAQRRWAKEPQETRQAVRPKANGSTGFAEFWNAYPRHEGKAKAENAWDKLHPDEQLRATIMQALELQKIKGCLAENFAADGRSTIPHGATWINGKRWEDEPPQAAPMVGEQASEPQPPTRKCESCGDRVTHWIGAQCWPCYRGEKAA